MMLFQCRFRATATGLVALGALAQASTAFAQTPGDFDHERYPTGLIEPSASALAGIPVATLTRAYIPEAIDLSASFPRPAQQKHGSCVAWATGYAARSYYARMDTQAPETIAANIPSPAYIYNQVYDRADRGGCEKAGTTFPQALSLLRQKGSFSMAEYGTELTCKTGSPLDQMTPSKFHISGFEKVSHFPEQPNNLDLFRQKLAKGHPVLIGMLVDKAFTDLRPGEIYRGRPDLTPPQMKALQMGGHALAMVGYDDRRRAFRLINSWDTTWGDGGFGWISYEAARAQIVHSFVMQTSQLPPEPKTSRPAISGRMPPGLGAKLTNARCADVRVSSVEDRADTTGGSLHYRFSGYVSRANDRTVIADFARDLHSESDVELKPWPVCEAMLHLAEPMISPSRPTVSTLDGRTTIKVGDTFGVRITTADVPSFLYAFYLEDDGTVVNLLPRQGILRAMTPAKTEIRLGDGREGRPTFRATALKTATTREDGERGYEAVVVISARAPIEELEELERPDGKFYRIGSRTDTAEDGPPDRLLLSTLRDLMQRRAGPDMLQREAGAAVLQLKIEE